MSQHTVELRPYQAITIGRRPFKIDAPQLHILVDGQFVGYVSRTPGCGLTVIDLVPQEIVLAIKEKVEEFWGQEVYAMNQARPIEAEEESDGD